MKLEIKRAQLKEIYEIACDGWKPRIEKYAANTPFSETIIFTEKQVNEMISACTAEQLPIVKGIFEIVETFENIKSLEDACKYLGESDEEVVTLRMLQSVVVLNTSVVNQQKAVVIVRALNEKHIFDWSNLSEYKYQIWWNMNEFSYHCYNYFAASSTVSARLCLKSKELCEYIGKNKEFIKIFESFMKQ